MNNRVLSSGDLLLMSGHTSVDLLIQGRLNNPWTQIGIIMTRPFNADYSLFYASRIATVKDNVLNKKIVGVQTVSLKHFMQVYNGNCAVRCLNIPLNIEKQNALIMLTEMLRGYPFEFSPYIAVRAKQKRNLASDNKRFFCCHLVAEAYQRLGLLSSPPNGRSSNNYVPSDFAQSTEDLPFLDDQVLGPEIPIMEIIKCIY